LRRAPLERFLVQSAAGGTSRRPNSRGIGGNAGRVFRDKGDKLQLNAGFVHPGNVVGRKELLLRNREVEEYRLLKQQQEQQGK
jgi:hypothetical protein